MSEFIPYGRQSISDDDIAAVVDVLKSDFLTQGPAVPQFEDAIRKRVKAKHAIAANSATSALHIACAALELGPGDLLWTSPVTFVASANCALYMGADVDFVDIDPVTYNMSPAALEAKLTDAAACGRLPKVIVPVHLSGEPCDMETIGGLAKKYGVRVIEDASHAIGGAYHGQPVGSCAHSDITVFSFHPVKIITSAEGGMAMTNDADLASRMQMLRSHGITRDPAKMTKASDGAWYYQQTSLGWNYRMTDIQAALGASQIDRLTNFLKRRHEIADRYDQMLASLPVTTPRRDPNAYSALHLYIIRVPKKAGVAAHQQVFDKMRAAGIGVNLHYIPVHLQPYYAELGFRPGMYPAAEAYYEEAISIPMYPDLSSQDQDRVVAVLKEALVE